MVRVLLSELVIAALTTPAHGQQAGPTSPSFAANTAHAENFDVEFDIAVPTWPTSPQLRNQTEDTRFDARNNDVSEKGAVRVDAQGRWGYLDLGVCTLFVNFNQVDLSRSDGKYEWSAKVYLPARR